MNMKKKWWIILIIVVVILGILVAGYYLLCDEVMFRCDDLCWLYPENCTPCPEPIKYCKIYNLF